MKSKFYFQILLGLLFNTCWSYNYDFTIFKKKSAFSVNKDDSLEGGNITFLLYTRNNSEDYEQLFYKNDDSLKKSHYSNEKDTKIIIHGWLFNYSSPVNKLLKEAFLSWKDVNVVVVDWTEYAVIPYDESCNRALSIGKSIASFIDWLIDKGTNVEKFHIMGHSMGGHIAGSAGRNVQNGIIPYITGLDPAKRNWENSTEKLNVKDALYVEIIHTTTDYTGNDPPHGHNDFYPNNGDNMTGCDGNGCSHDRAFEYFAESIGNERFTANQCANYGEILANNCSNLSRLHMGGGYPKKAVGVFTLKTNDNPPYWKIESNQNKEL